MTGTGVWAELRTFDLQPGRPVTVDLGDTRAYWVRAVANRDCTSTVQFDYR